MLNKIWALWAPGALDHGPYGPQGPWALCLDQNFCLDQNLYHLHFYKHTNNFFKGSGGLLGPSWTFPDLFGPSNNKFKHLKNWS